jgi:hypothetical protein
MSCHMWYAAKLGRRSPRQCIRLNDAQFRFPGGDPDEIETPVVDPARFMKLDMRSGRSVTSFRAGASTASYIKT